MKTYRRTIDGNEMIFARSADGTQICEPVDIDSFSAYVSALGPELLQEKVAELRGGSDTEAWKVAAQARLDELGDQLRRDRLAKQTTEIFGVYRER